jgi:hypothetical protein
MMMVAGGSLSAAAGELCPAGGVLIKVAVDKEKAVEWLEDERLAYLLNEDDGWTVTTFSSKTDDIAAVWGEDYIFYGVADDREDEVRERDMNKAFGNELAKLKDAVQDEFRELRKRGVIDIEGDDVAKIAGAVGLGTLSKDGDDWVLEAADCDAMTVNVDEIK